MTEPLKIERSQFVRDAMALAIVRCEERPILSMRETRQLIGDESAELYRLLQQATTYPAWPWEDARHRLLLIAATCIQASQQLGLDSRGDAIGKEIPF